MVEERKEDEVLSRDDSVIPTDASPQERMLLENFLIGLQENNLPTACKIQRLNSRTVNVEYKGVLLGGFKGNLAEIQLALAKWMNATIINRLF